MAPTFNPVLLKNNLFIGGVWREASTGKRIDVFDPSTEQVISSVVDASLDDAKLAVDPAHKAAPGWAATSPRKRSDILMRAFTLMLERADWMADL